MYFEVFCLGSGHKVLIPRAGGELVGHEIIRGIIIGHEIIFGNFIGHEIFQCKEKIVGHEIFWYNFSGSFRFSVENLKISCIIVFVI